MHFTTLFKCLLHKLKINSWNCINKGIQYSAGNYPAWIAQLVAHLEEWAIGSAQVWISPLPLELHSILFKRHSNYNDFSRKMNVTISFSFTRVIWNRIKAIWCNKKHCRTLPFLQVINKQWSLNIELGRIVSTSGVNATLWTKYLAVTALSKVSFSSHCWFKRHCTGPFTNLKCFIQELPGIVL